MPTRRTAVCGFGRDHTAPATCGRRATTIDPTDESFGFDASDAVPVSAGGVVFFNGYLLHRSMRDRSDRTRRALVNHYMSATSLLPYMIAKGIDVGTDDYEPLCRSLERIDRNSRRVA